MPFIERNEPWRQMLKQALCTCTLVCGPPASGKTTYVAERRKPGDIVWDFDAIVQTLTGLPMHETPQDLIGIVCELREAFFDAIGTRTDNRRHVWVISCSPKRLDRASLIARLKATLAMMPTDENTCNERMLARGKSTKSVREWFAAYEP